MYNEAVLPQIQVAVEAKFLTVFLRLFRNGEGVIWECFDSRRDQATSRLHVLLMTLLPVQGLIRPEHLLGCNELLSERFSLSSRLLTPKVSMKLLGISISLTMREFGISASCKI